MKIMVSTDFSESSKAGLRMAAALAAQLNAELHIIHVTFFPGKAGETVGNYEARAAKGLKDVSEKLVNFTKPLVNNLKDPIQVFYHVEVAFIPETGIHKLQKSIKAELICVSTRGAGTLPKLLGTTAGNLITQSTIPVLAVPVNHRPKALRKFVFFCDLENPVRELRKLLPLTNALSANVALVHFSKVREAEKARMVLDKKLAMAGIDIKREVIPRSGNSVIRNMLNYSDDRKPSAIVVFTRERKSFLQKIFHASRSEELAFHTRYPLLVFHKK